MPYDGGNFSYLAVLPRENVDLLDTLETISEPDEWNKMMESLSFQKCDVYIPKYLIKTKTDVKTMLKKVILCIFKGSHCSLI